MNIHFQQAEKKSHVLFYMLAALVVFSISMLILNIDWHSEFRLSVRSLSSYGASTENSSMPVAVPAPLPSAEELQVRSRPVPSSTPSPSPQAVAVPVPDLP
jgi:hypothetical protein